MPRGQASHTQEWNFRVKRHECPDCQKKGLYKTTETAGFKCGRREVYRCMYCRASYKPTELTITI